MLKIKVENMQSSRGNDIPNQFVITTDEGRYFQSYNSVIAFKPYNKEEAFYKMFAGYSLADLSLNEYPSVYLDEKDWDYSKTTGKYRNLFLNEGIAETRKAILNGQYKLVDLNS